jgi:CRP-like cAMP-binding protein
MLDWSAPLPEVSYPSGTVLIQEGEVHGKLFVLLDGALEISRTGTRITVVGRRGGRPRSAPGPDRPADRR